MRSFTSFCKRRGGFTLFELIVVMMILGMIAFLVVPRVSSFKAGEMKRTVRHLAGAISYLTQESAATKETYRLYFNLDSNDYWAATVLGSGETVTVKENPTIKRRHLSDGIMFEDIKTAQQGKVTEGEIFAEFYPTGIEAMAIHLKQGKRDEEEGLEGEYFTLLVNPLTGRVKVFDRYVE